MYSFLQVFFSLFSALLLTLAIPNELFEFGSPILGLFCLIPFYSALRRAKSVKEAFFLSFLHGATVHLCSSFWLGNFQGYALFTLGASLVGTGFFQGFLSFFFYYPALNLASFGGKKIGQEAALASFRPLWFSGTYTLWEFFKSTGFLAYPWGTVSMTAYRWSLITQIADITGPYGITFLFSLFSATISEYMILRVKGIKKSDSFLNLCTLLCALFLISAVYGAFELLLPRESVKTVNAVLVQQNGDPWFKGEEQSILISEALSEEKINDFRENDEECDVVVWSEAVLSKRFPSARFFYNSFPNEKPLTPFIKQMNVPFIIGGPYTISIQPRRVANSAIFFNKNGEFSGEYQKMHLVPFAELIPGSEYPFIRNIMREIAGFSYGWYPGKCVTLMEIPISSPVRDTRKSKIISIDIEKNENEKNEEKTVKIATPICFDDTAAEVCRAMFLYGSELFVNITNDAWSLTRSAEIQHFVVSHYRAIEYRTTLARATNAGLTAVVGPTGKTLCSLPLFEEGALCAKIPVYERKMTTYALFGNWLPVSILIFSFIFVIKTSFFKKEIDERF